MLEITFLSKLRHFDIVLNFCVILISVCFITCSSYSELSWQYPRYFLVPLERKLMLLTARNHAIVLIMSFFSVCLNCSQCQNSWINTQIIYIYFLHFSPRISLLYLLRNCFNFVFNCVCQISHILMLKTSFSVLCIYSLGSILCFYGSNVFSLCWC